MNSFAPLLCIVATFVLMSDHQKIVAAKSLAKRGLVDKYTTKYDNIDIDRILQSKRLMQNYVNCLLEKGPCTADGKELKSKCLKFYFVVFSLFNF